MRAMLVATAVAIMTGAVIPGPADADDTKPPPPRIEAGADGEPTVVHEGEASFYGDRFHGRPTATGERFDQNKPTAASRELPLGTKATVINQENGRSVDVIINDRGPYAKGRVIDLSKEAARRLDMIEEGTAEVRVEMKPSEQPTEKARAKVEEKAEELVETSAQSGESDGPGQAAASGATR
ncbi:MAG TPA: septal ring lytic transglycosylase RlpA family protein [Azospirillaceae bacterium]|nr:septal ring lytic transglycosylase RlpA family protein [Azospirillaceae bacterium]